MRTLQVKMQDETQTVVASGVAPNERVVTTGFARLTDGAKVTIGSGNGAAPAQGALQGVGPHDGQQRPAGTHNGERRQRGGGGSRTNTPQ
jgi:multidrug efflux system membrane fusion protein